MSPHLFFGTERKRLPLWSCPEKPPDLYLPSPLPRSPLAASQENRPGPALGYLVPVEGSLDYHGPVPLTWQKGLVTQN